MTAIFFYQPRVVEYQYGTHHPFRLERIWLARHLTEALGLFGEGNSLESFGPASRDDLLAAHDSSYLDILEQASEGTLPPEGPAHGLGSGDNPVFKGLWDYCLLTAGGSISAAEAVVSGRAQRAFHPGGGLHHAMRARASGFCYVNDVVLAIKRLLGGGKRVFYLDIDAHHADGVQDAFYCVPDVLTLSIHQDGRTLFPGTGFINEIGEGAGLGRSVNVPLLPGSSDGSYAVVLERIVEPLFLAFKPDCIVTELGADALAGDPLTSLEMSLRGWWRILRWIASQEVPWVAVGGGGYDLANTMRAWALAWAAMVGADPEDLRMPGPPDDLPRIARSMHWPKGFWDQAAMPQIGENLEVTSRIVAAVRERVFPHFDLEP